jgi:hypothetical protein
MTTAPTRQPIAVPCENGALLLIEPPEGWLMSPPAPPARLSLLDPRAPAPLRPNLNVVAQDLGKMTPEEYLTLTRLQLKGMGANAAVERDEPLGRGSGGHLFEYVANLGPMAVRCRQLILLQDGWAYCVTALALVHQFEAHRAAMEGALNSVVLRLSTGAQPSGTGA